MFFKDFTHLLNAIKEREPDPVMRDDYFTYLETDIQKFPNYVKAVHAAEVSDKIAGVRMQCGDWTIDKFQAVVKSNDDNRRLAHDRAIEACKTINKICDHYHVKHICPEIEGRATPEDRIRVGDFCAAVTAETFMVGTNRDEKTLDHIMQEIHNGARIKGERHREQELVK